MSDLHDDTPVPADATPPDPSGLPKRLRGTHPPQDEVPPTALGRTAPGRQDQALERARICARIAEENRGRDIALLDLRGSTPLVDFFLIVTAASRRQANAMTSDIDAAMKRIGEFKIGIEASEEGRWTLIDYGDFVVHVFSEEGRAYYALEDVWGDCPRLDWQEADPDRPTTTPDTPESTG